LGRDWCGFACCRAGVKWDIDLERGMLGVWEGTATHEKIEDVTAAGEPLPPISQRIWELRYRQEGSEATLADTFRRVARAVAQPESDPEWAGRFEGLLMGQGFLPGGRILAGAGTSRRVTLFNCFVMAWCRIQWKGSSPPCRKVRSPCNRAVAWAPTSPPCGRAGRAHGPRGRWPPGRCPSCACGTPCAPLCRTPASGGAP